MSSKQEENLHDESMLMVPPPGFKFIPRYEMVCGKPGCFECFDIYCERCESKDRRIVELEMRNNDLIKYITQLQGRIFGRSVVTSSEGGVASINLNPSNYQQQQPATMTSNNAPPLPMNNIMVPPSTGIGGSSGPFAYIQSPVLYDPNMNLSYVATTSFSPAPHDLPGARKT